MFKAALARDLVEHLQQTKFAFLQKIGGIDMELYWVSLIIQDAENSKPWLSAMSSGCVSLEEGTVQQSEEA